MAQYISTRNSSVYSFTHGVQDLATSNINFITLPSNEAMLVFNWVFVSVVCQSIDVFGVCTNIINIMCFVNMGFKDPVNVSLLGLAFSDLGSLATLIWSNICLNPSFMSLNLPFDPIEFQHLVSTTPHVVFTRITSWITALITLERCLCIIAPLKIKNIFTVERVALIITCIFITLALGVTPVYVVNRLGLKFVQARNRTVIGLLYTDDRESVERFSYVVNNVVVPFTAFVLITICTIILSVKLHEKTKWRKTTTISVQADNVSNRNLKVAKMVVMISTTFITCFVPVSINSIAMSVVPELSPGGMFVNILIIIMGIGFLLESINSAVNIFIYYHMSSKYKTVFSKIFGSRNANHLNGVNKK